ncbi:MAG TPA: Crp/Fnr family transcriptional regulator [Ramlibacter sp.]|nr:Crp/Fnr family transcriptional regulator [Ramlibacter sp.]
MKFQSPIGLLHDRAMATLFAQSGLLASLPEDVQQRLLPHLIFVELPTGHMLAEPHRGCARALFPLAGVVSLVQEMPDGASGQVAVVGNEGLLGLPLFMGGDAMPTRGVVHCAGYGLALDRDCLVEEFERGGSFMRHLLRYTQALITQISQVVVCNRHHSIEQQLCRLLLMSLDRLQHDEVPLTQEFAARLLGVRREGVTEAAGRLREAGVVGCRRGAFAVQNRRALEERACGCYRVVKNEYDRLLPAPRPQSASPARVPPLHLPMPAPAVVPTLPGWNQLAELAG